MTSERYIEKEICWDDEKAGRLWNFYASSEAYSNQYFSSHSGKALVVGLKKYVDFAGVVLDLGCGPGHLIEQLLRTKAETIHGMDFSASSIERVSQRFAGHPKFGLAVCAEAFPSIFPDDSMDMIICVEVVEHLNDDQLLSLLGEAYRLLRPQGKLVITTPNEENLDASKTICPECGCIFHRWQHIRSFNAKGLRMVLGSVGFETVVAQPCYFGTWDRKLIWWSSRLYRALQGRDPGPKPHLLAVGRKGPGVPRQR